MVAWKRLRFIIMYHLHIRANRLVVGIHSKIRESMYDVKTADNKKCMGNATLVKNRIDEVNYFK